MLNPSTQPASDGRRRGLAVVRALIVLFLVAGLLATTTAPRPVGAAGLVGGDAEIGRYTFADLADRVLPSVVTVYVKQSMKMELSRGDRPDDLNRLRDFFRGNPGLRELFPELPDDEDQGRPESAPDLYDMDGEFVPTSSGSGIILSEDGYILTNHHVLSEGLRSAQNFTQSEDKQLTVVLGDGQEISGDDVKVVYSHPLADLAILKIDKSGLTPIKWGDSDKLRVGERIAAIGSPLDLKATVTQGIICAKNRDVANMSQLIQTDAVINPGSSGGALVNLDGELVGVNRLIATNTGRWQGFGFAIPSNDAKWFADEVISKGQIEFGYLGVLMWPETSEKMRMLSTLGFTPNQTGVLIQGLPDNPSVSEGNPARNAGLQVGDVIVEADGHPVRTNLDLLDYVRRRPDQGPARQRSFRTANRGFQGRPGQPPQ
jgi:serine protease Do